MTDDLRPPWAVRLQAEREQRGWSKPRMARELYAAIGVTEVDSGKARSLARQILGWEKGEHFPQSWAAAYAAAYAITEKELFGDGGPASATVSRPAGTLTATTNRTAEWMSSMERRNLLMLMGLGVTAPWPVAENLRAALTRTAGASDSVADWRETASDYCSTMGVTPAATILPDLLSDLNEVNALLETGHPEQGPLLEVAAVLAAFTSMATYDSGHPGRAFRWWRTAQQLADKSGYAPVRAYIRARRGADLLEGRKQTDQALQLANEAIRIAHDRPSLGLAEAYALRARALADDGNPAAHGVLDDMARTAGRPVDSRETYAQCPAQTRVHRARMITYLKLGDGAAAVRAGQSDPHPKAQMDMAAGMILQGKIDDGLGHAVHTLNGLDPVTDTLSMRQRGWEVLAVVPDRARDSATARELRALTRSGPIT